MEVVRDFTESSITELEMGPELITLSNHPIWAPQMSKYIEKFKRSQHSDASCRQMILNSIPDADPFRHLKESRQILDALRSSYDKCIFLHFRPYPTNEHFRYWRDGEVCQYSCCERCEFVKSAIHNLGDRTPVLNTSRIEVSIREKEDVLFLGSTQSPLLSVSINCIEKNKQAKVTPYRVFDMIVRNDNVWSTDESFHSTSEERLQLAGRWLQECRNKHNCRPANTGFIPRRLVRVGEHPQLVETATDLKDKQVKYAALSYCWGPAKATFTTTYNNYEANRGHIFLDQLPKTIRDGIYICCNLGLEYLWVDALCIIQDADNVDWLEQCGQMRLVYSNAELTIAADESTACTKGFWHPDNTKFNNLNKYCWVREIAVRSQDILSTRGWTLQERILSHRILHFSNAGISWECDACCRFEDGQTKIDLIGLSYRAFRLLNRSTPPHECLGTFTFRGHIQRVIDYGTGNITDFLTSGSWKSIFFAWATIMENYSRRDLTQPNDKLTAISGLASFVLSETGFGAESYLAGLWKEGLVEGLLWYVSSPGACRSSSSYIAPTWSWASITGSINYFHDRYQFRFRSHVKIKDTYCTACPSDPTGRVTAGSIHLDGLMVEVDLVAFTRPDSFRSTYKDAGGRSICAQNQYITFIRLHMGVNGDESSDSRWYEVMHDEETRLIDTNVVDLLYEHQDDMSAYLGACNTSAQSRYFCLSVGELVDSVTGGQRDWFLVLRKTLQNGEVYERVGIGYFQFSKGKDFSLFDTSEIYSISIV